MWNNLLHALRNVKKSILLFMVTLVKLLTTLLYLSHFLSYTRNLTNQNKELILNVFIIIMKMNY